MYTTDQDSARLRLFDDDSLAYLKAIGNVTFFIHGFNVPQGDYPFEIDDVLQGLDPTGDASIKWSKNKRTIYNSKKMVEKQFDVSSKTLSKTLDDSTLNGTGACNWFLHMENNLNVATEQFKHKDYMKYTRVVGISWAGDVGIPDYVASEDRADETASMMAAMVMQLIQAKVEINIIAHSMGNRVLMQLLELLGVNNHKNVINHVFLWEAALPSTALSNNPQLDKTTRGNCSFSHAHIAAQKFTVLYSRQDDVLTLPYWLGTYIGKTPRQLWGDRGIPGKIEAYDIKSRHHKRILMQLVLDKDFMAYLEYWIQESVYNWLDISSIGAYFNETVFNVQKELVKRYQLDMALGYNGPDMKDPFIEKLYDQGRLFLADMTQWGVGHSYMRIPNADVMKYGYKTWIINQIRGMKNFGPYDSEKFPNSPAFSPGTPFEPMHDWSPT